MAAIVRAVLRHKVTNDELETEYSRGFSDGRDRGAGDRERLEQQVSSADDRTRKIHAFEQASGLSLTYLDDPKLKLLGHNVAQYLRAPDKIRAQLRRQRVDIATLLEQLDKTIEALV